MTKDKFSDVMSKRTDSELLEIVTKLRTDYQPDAVAAAETELKKRNLSADKIEKAEKGIQIKNQAIADKANTPLQTHWKVLTFIFPCLVSLLIAGAMKGEGYDRRGKDAWRWTFYGFGFYFGFFILMIFIFWLAT